MNNDTARQVTGADEEERRVDSENCCVCELKGRNEKGCFHILASSYSFYHVMKMGNAKKEWRHDHSTSF